jgi:adenylate kinase
LNLVFLGAPGSGKGTQAKMVKDRYSLAHISTGDILRAEMKAGTELGLEAKKVMEAGGLVSDDIILGMMDQRLRQPDCERGYILDGFPRTLAQAEGLEKTLEGMDRDLGLGVLIQVDEEAVVQRLSSRRTCKDCGTIFGRADLVGDDGELPVEGKCPKCGGTYVLRDDDRPETVRNRLSVYAAETEPVVDFFRGRDRLVEIDGSQAPDMVSDAIFSILRDHFGEQS